MGEVRVNVSNFIAIGLIAFIGVWVINRVLIRAGKPQYVA